MTYMTIPKAFIYLTFFLDDLFKHGACICNALLLVSLLHNTHAYLFQIQKWNFEATGELHALVKSVPLFDLFFLVMLCGFLEVVCGYNLAFCDVDSACMEVMHGKEYPEIFSDGSKVRGPKYRWTAKYSDLQTY